MSVIRNLGEGYYGVEATSGAMSKAVLDPLDDASAEAMEIPDDDIVVADHRYLSVSKDRSDAASANVPCAADR
jgi:hypothetical protein